MPFRHLNSLYTTKKSRSLITNHLGFCVCILYALYGLFETGKALISLLQLLDAASRLSLPHNEKFSFRGGLGIAEIIY